MITCATHTNVKKGVGGVGMGGGAVRVMMRVMVTVMVAKPGEGRID